MKSIKGYEGRYSATEDGFIYSHITQKKLKGRSLPNGYLRVFLVDGEGKTKEFLVHRLICKTFHPEGEGCVNHIDCNKKNNRPENLEWCNHSYNMKHASANGLLKSQSERMSLFNKKNFSIRVISIDSNGNEEVFSSMSEAELKGYSHSKISLCCSGKRKTHKGRRWRYG